MINFFKRNTRPVMAAVFFFAVAIGFNLYFLSKYRVGPLEMKRLSLSTDVDKQTVVVYIKSDGETDMDFTSPLVGHTERDQLVFDFPGKKIRTFGVYFGKKENKASVDNVTLNTPETSEYFSLSEFRLDKMKVISANTRGFTFFGEGNASFALKHERITFGEMLMAEFAIFLSAILFSYLLMRFAPFPTTIELRDAGFKVLIVSAFFASIFLPHPIFNVFFISSLIFTINGFKYRKLLSNIPGLLFIAYFLIFMTNNLFISQSFNARMTETYIPILLLPIYFASIPGRNYVKLLPMSAFLLSVYLFSTSLIDAVVYRNPEYFSFDFFTKYLHPIYFSYLLFFSIVYIELDEKNEFNKKVYLFVFLVALICCGSKLIISLTLLFYFFRFMKKRVLLASVFLLLAVGSIFLFAPTRKRFQEIVGLKNLSILAEKPIRSFHDPRLNGLTLRLILWQESLTAADGFKDLMFGKGVDSNADEILKTKLINRGLEEGHAKYDPHNQFIATYYRLGLIGLIVLISICVYVFYYAYKNRNTLLYYCMLLFMAAMLTESVLQRVLGIYFFICILLLNSTTITKSTRHFENSDTGNKRNS